MRDLRKDLEICNKATPGPWNGEENTGVEPVFETGCGCCTESTLSKEDAEFIAEAREGWPHAIERAIKAEAKLDRLIEGCMRCAGEDDHERFQRLRAEVDRLRLMVTSITEGLDEAIEAVHYLEAENALLRKVEEVGEILWSEAICHRCEARECRECSAHDFKKALSEYLDWREHNMYWTGEAEAGSKNSRAQTGGSEMNLRITVDNNEVRRAVADVILAEYGIPVSPEDIEFVFIHGYGVRAVYEKEAKKDDQEGQG